MRGRGPKKKFVFPTPMLFRHHTHSTAFTLVVDDFLVRYSHPSELDHLVSCLSTLYELKVHRDLPRYTYLGYTIDYSPTSLSPCMTLSMPKLRPLYALTPLSVGVWVGLIPCCLHAACITYRLSSPPFTLIYHHPFHPSLSRREDVDPTSSWVLALLCKST